jgi:hypothetical protein
VGTPNPLPPKTPHTRRPQCTRDKGVEAMGQLGWVGTCAPQGCALLGPGLAVSTESQAVVKRPVLRGLVHSSWSPVL